MSAPLSAGVTHKRVDAMATKTACDKPIEGRVTVLTWRETSCAGCWAKYRARVRKGAGSAWREFPLAKARR